MRPSRDIPCSEIPRAPEGLRPACRTPPGRRTAPSPRLMVQGPRRTWSAVNAQTSPSRGRSLPPPAPINFPAVCGAQLRKSTRFNHVSAPGMSSSGGGQGELPAGVSGPGI